MNKITKDEYNEMYETCGYSGLPTVDAAEG